jgi:hypothetical protein
MIVRDMTYTGNQGDYTFAANADGSLTVRDVNVANDEAWPLAA